MGVPCPKSWAPEGKLCPSWPHFIFTRVGLELFVMTCPVWKHGRSVVRLGRPRLSFLAPSNGFLIPDFLWAFGHCTGTVFRSTASRDGVSWCRLLCFVCFCGFNIFLDILSASCLSGRDSRTDQFFLGHCIYACNFETDL